MTKPPVIKRRVDPEARARLDRLVLTALRRNGIDPETIPNPTDPAQQRVQQPANVG